jgi:DNA-directed RNA polymerase specialized sigma24 family protein
LRNYISNEHDRAQAKKRGGGKCVLSIDFDSAESGYRRDLSHDLTPDTLFEKRWALTVLETALATLEKQDQEAGKSDHFNALVPFLTVDGDPPEYSEVAKQLDMTEGAVKMAVSRLRRRYRQLIRDEVRRTLSDFGDVDEEIRNLFKALSQ